MATNLLDTRTVNYLDLMGNWRVYRVPPYQRDYSWSKDQWEDLWQDIADLGTGGERRHYLGAIVVEAVSDREFRVIDGQQRLATLSLLALAVIQKLEHLAERGVESDNNRERARTLRSRFIGEKDPASLLESSKLTLNETDNGVFQDYLVQGRTPIGIARLPKSNALLVQATEFFRKRLDEEPSLSEDGRRLASILSETIARGLLFIQIAVENDLSAYTVFETLNARGLELSTTDLLKNYLFSRMSGGSDLDHLQRRWKALIAVTTQERFPEFLRYHLLCSHRKIRTGRLFKTVREDVRTGTQVLDLMTRLESRAEIFAGIGDPTHFLWSERPEVKPSIGELRLFRVRQMTPLVFAAYERLDRQAFESVMRTLVVVSFRYSVVSGLNTNDLEPVYSDAAQAVLRGEAKSARDVFERLRPIYVQDDKMRQDFAGMTSETTGPRKKITRYMLLRLEAQRSGRTLDYETDPATIEHVLPENPLEAWNQSIPVDRWDAFIYRLGNLTPLEAAINRNLGNAEYHHKAAEYAKSGYDLTRTIPLASPEEWTIFQIERRQAEFAELAVRIWRCDY